MPETATGVFYLIIQSSGLYGVGCCIHLLKLREINTGAMISIVSTAMTKNDVCLITN